MAGFEAANAYINQGNTLRSSLQRAIFLYEDEVFCDGTLAYKELGREAAHVAHELRLLVPLGDAVVAIAGDSNENWVIADLACTLASFVTVGIHAEWPQNEVEFVLRNSEAKLLLLAPCTSPGVEATLVAAAASVGGGIRVVILDDLRGRTREAGTEGSYLSPLLTSSGPEAHDDGDSDGDKLFSLMYTSGTSGVPKGVVTARGKWKEDNQGGLGKAKSVIVCYNSFAHGSDRGRVWMSIFSGGRVSFVTEESLLLDEMVNRQATHLFAFGNYWTSLYNQFMSDVDVQSKVAALARNVDAIATGGTHTLPAAKAWLYKAFPRAGRLTESYGSTEQPGMASATNAPSPDAGMTLNDGTFEFKLADVPEQGYYASEGCGEICVKNKSKYAFRGYWKNPEATAKTFDADGFYHTTDIGRIDAMGKLHIIDRMSSLVELYLDGRSVWVAVAKLEAEVFSLSGLVQKIYLYGDRMLPHLVAVVLPSSKAIEEQVSNGTILVDLKRIANEHGLHAYESPGAIVVDRDMQWTFDSGLATITGKLKRSALFKHYEAEIMRALEVAAPVPSSPGHSPARALAEPPTAGSTTLCSSSSSSSEQRGPWINQSIDGITDFLDFRFSTPACPEAAESLNAIKIGQMDPLARQMRPVLSKMAEDAELADKACAMQLGETVEEGDRRVKAALTKLLECTSKDQLHTALTDWIEALSWRLAKVRQAHLQQSMLKASHVEAIAKLDLTRSYDAANESLKALALTAYPFRVAIPNDIAMAEYCRGARLPVGDQRMQQEGGNSMGGDQFTVWCSVSGQLLQMDNKDAGVERYVSLDDDTIVQSKNVYDEFRQVRQHLLICGGGGDLLALLDRVDLLGSSMHAVETSTHFFNSRDVLREEKSPKFLILKALECYATRPGLGQPESWPDVHSLTSPELTRDGYRWATNAKIRSAALDLATSLSRLLPRGAHVAICGFNTIDWLVCDFACAIAGLVSVGIHSTYNDDEAAAVLAHAQVQFVVAHSVFVSGGGGSKQEGQDRLLSSNWSLANVVASGRAPNIRGVALMDVTDERDAMIAPLHAAAEQHKQRLEIITTVSALISSSEQDEAALLAAEPVRDTSALFSLLLTSGSSGKPKAVAFSSEGWYKDIYGGVVFGRLVTVSYIPLSHSSDRFKCWKFLCNGGRVGMAHYDPSHWIGHEKEKKAHLLRAEGQTPEGGGVGFGGVQGLLMQVAAIKPNAVAFPPNIWQNLYLMAKSDPAAESAIKGWLASVTSVSTGGAPTSPEVLAWARALLWPKAHIEDSYGITEFGGVTADGSVYKDHRNVQVKLVEMPEAGLLHPYGEIYVRQDPGNGALGYFNDKEQTAAAFLPDRWYRTGDLGKLCKPDLCGKAQYEIVDRVSAVVSGAVVVAIGPEATGAEAAGLVRPQAIEDAIQEGLLGRVLDCFIDVQQTVITAVLIVSKDDVTLGQEHWLVLVRSAAADSGRQLPTAVILDHEPFSLENQLLTVSFKKARAKIKAKYGL